MTVQSPKEQIVALIEKRGFLEQSMKKDLFIATFGDTKVGVDLAGEKPVVGVFLNNIFLDEGHGSTKVYALRDELMLIWEKGAGKVKKEAPAPKEESKGEMKKMEEKKNEKTLVPQEKAKPLIIKKPLTDAELDARIEMAKAKRFLEERGKSYKVKGKERPDAHKIQQVANERAISIEIISAIQTDTYSDIIVRGYLGKQFIDACVHHDFATEYQLKAMEIIQKNPQILDHYEGTSPVIKEGAMITVYEDGKNVQKDAKYYLVHTLLSFKKFSLRDARTKAASIAEAMLLNRDWRDEDEIQSELSERAIVEEIIKNTKETK